MAALIWLLLGGVVEAAIEHFANPLLNDYLTTEWIFVGWLGPTLLLAISGFRQGRPANRICAVLALAVFVVPLLMIVWIGFTLRNH